MVLCLNQENPITFKIDFSLLDSSLYVFLRDLGVSVFYNREIKEALEIGKSLKLSA